MMYTMIGKTMGVGCSNNHVRNKKWSYMELQGYAVDGNGNPTNLNTRPTLTGVNLKYLYSPDGFQQEIQIMMIVICFLPCPFIKSLPIKQTKGYRTISTKQKLFFKN